MSESSPAESGIVVDDAARYLETLIPEERIPRFDRNGLPKGPDIPFTSGEKRAALSLSDPE